VKFGAVPVEYAEGAILAHTLHLPSGVLKKGRCLSEEDLAALGAAGHTEVVAARLEPGDIPEDGAAATVATAAAGEGVRVGPAYTGRANLYAEVRGVLLVQRERVDALNEVNEGMTVATATPGAVVEAGEMVATVKVIPFGLFRAVVERCATLARVGAHLLAIAPLRSRRVGLVLTRLPGTRESTLDKASGVLRARVEALGSVVGFEARCAHAEVEVAAAVCSALDDGCAPVVVFGASAMVDRHDVVPAAIVRAGGVIEHFGMPVDPGNLLLLGEVDGAAVVGAPGCARSPQPSGFDDVLQRLLAGVSVRALDVQHMGAGGLLKEIRSRPQPRGLGSEGGAGRRVVDAIVLAAGRSRRMGQANKLLAEVDGEPMVARVVRTLRGSRVREVIVVTGHQAEPVRGALEGSGARIVHNPDFEQGMSTSLAAGLGALAPGADGALIALGDMPLLRPPHVEALLEAFDPLEGRAVVVPTHRGKRGNPVLWAARFFPEMRALAGDVGARALFLAHAGEVCEVPIDDEAVLVDVDTPEALAALHGEAD